MQNHRPRNAAEARTAHPDTIERVYVGTPLGAPTRLGVLHNFRRAMYANRLLLDEGYAAVAPHILYCMLLDEHNPDHRTLGINYDMALMPGFHRCVLFTPDGTPATLSSGMHKDVERASDLDRRWSLAASRLDAEMLTALDGMIRSGMPVEFRVWPEVPEDWSPSWLTPGGYWMKSVETLEIAAPLAAAV